MNSSVNTQSIPIELQRYTMVSQISPLFHGIRAYSVVISSQSSPRFHMQEFQPNINQKQHKICQDFYRNLIAHFWQKDSNSSFLKIRNYLRVGNTVRIVFQQVGQWELLREREPSYLAKKAESLSRAQISLKLLNQQNKIQITKNLLILLKQMAQNKFGLGEVSLRTCLLVTNSQAGHNQMILKVKTTYLTYLSNTPERTAEDMNYISPETLSDNYKVPDFFDSLWGVAMTIFHLTDPTNSHFFDDIDAIAKAKSSVEEAIINWVKDMRNKPEKQLTQFLQTKVKVKKQKLKSLYEINDSRVKSSEQNLKDYVISLIRCAILKKQPDQSVYALLDLNTLKKQVQNIFFKIDEHDLYQNLTYADNQKQFLIMEEEFERFYLDLIDRAPRSNPIFKSIFTQIGDELVEIFRPESNRLYKEIVVNGKFLYMQPNGQIIEEQLKKEAAYQFVITIRTQNGKQQSRVIFVRKKGFHWLKANKMIYTQDKSLFNLDTETKWSFDRIEQQYPFDNSCIHEPNSNHAQQLREKIKGIPFPSYSKERVHQSYIQKINQIASLEFQELSKKQTLRIEKYLSMKLFNFIGFSLGLKNYIIKGPQIEGKIIQLNLSNNSLGDSVLDIIGYNRLTAFTKVGILSLTDNNITTEGFAKFFNRAKIYSILPNLKTLKLSVNLIEKCDCIQIRRCICICPHCAPSECECKDTGKCNKPGNQCEKTKDYFPSLENLGLDYNKIKTVENHTFESLKKLTQVDLTGNPFIEDDKNVFLKGLLKYGTEGKAIYGGIFPELDARQKYRQ